MSQTNMINRVIKAAPTSDGDGVKIRRVALFDSNDASPILMVDELNSNDEKDYVGGFPPHPHRGIETLTYMLEGHFQHKDQMGNVGELHSGGAQWMAAGRGVIHSEMPMMDQGQLHGFQIWINQFAEHKMRPSQYQDFQSESITEHSTPDIGKIRVIAGKLYANENVLLGPLQQTSTPITVADWQPNANNVIEISHLSGLNVSMFVYAGQIQVGDENIEQGHFALLNDLDILTLTANKSSGALFFAGNAINEPVVHYGPFVMNSVQEIEQAIEDYNNGVFHNY